MNDENVNRTVFCDLDGVLCDFDKGFFDLTGMTTDQVKSDELWSRINAHGRDKFFMGLPWMPGGKDLWKFITENFLKVKILSSLGKSDLTDNLSTKGKMGWLNKNIPSLRNEDIILVVSKGKKRAYSKPGEIIIDDTEEIIREWNQKGGIGMLHKTSQDTISKLRQYI